MIRLAILKEFTIPSEQTCKCGAVRKNQRSIVLEVNQEQFVADLLEQVGKRLKSKYTRQNILEAVEGGFKGVSDKYSKETMFIK